MGIKKRKDGFANNQQKRNVDDDKCQPSVPELGSNSTVKAHEIVFVLLVFNGK